MARVQVSGTENRSLRATQSFLIARRETFDAHQILLKLKFTCLPFLLSLICLPLTISFGRFAHKSAKQWFWRGFLGCLFSDSQRCCIEILTTFLTAWTSQNRAGHSWQPKKMLRKVSVRNWKFMEGKSQELAKPRSSFTISRQRSSSSYWSCITFVSYTAARSLFSMTCRSLESDLTSSR